MFLIRAFIFFNRLSSIESIINKFLILDLISIKITNNLIKIFFSLYITNLSVLSYKFNITNASLFFNNIIIIFLLINYINYIVII